MTIETKKLESYIIIDVVELFLRESFVTIVKILKVSMLSFSHHHPNILSACREPL